MKLIKNILLLCTTVAYITSCDKNTNLLDENNKWVYIDSANSANIKLVQVFAANSPTLPTASTTTNGPQVFVYANGAKLNATSLSYGGIWPATAVYGALQPGSIRFDIINGRMDLTVVPNVPKFAAGDTLATITATLEKGKYYSLYIGDSVPNARITIKEDKIVNPEYQKYKIRAANFFMNNNPTDTVSIFSVRQNAEIISDVTHKNVSDWVELPLPIISDTLIFRKKGTTTSYAALNGFSPVGQRMYTFVGRGKNTVTGKTPVAAVIINR